MRKLVLTFSHSHNVMGNGHVRPASVEKLNGQRRAGPPAGDGNGRPSATVGRVGLAARIPRSSAQPPSVAAAGRFCRSERSASIKLQVSVVDPQLCKTTSSSLSSNPGNFFDSSGKVLIVGIAGWHELLMPSNCEIDNFRK